jgi:hypothetical protein
VKNNRGGCCWVLVGGAAVGVEGVALPETVVTAVGVGGVAVGVDGVVVPETVVTAVAVVPSEKVAVRVSIRPGKNSMPCKSDANTTKLPPSATGKFTAIVPGAFSKAPPAVGATPSIQNPVPLFVSQVPGASLSRRNPVTVLPPLPLNVTVSVPSNAPSGPTAVLPWPTRSLTLPL